MVFNGFIGIISWLPDGRHRAARAEKCRELIARCRDVFGLPVVAVAQNWREDIPRSGVTALEYPRLGITAARKALWEYFRSSAYDWIICFDDDCVLEGTRGDGDRLKAFLGGLHDGYLCRKPNEFKLCAIHRSVAEMFDIPDIDVENGTGIEDYAFFSVLGRAVPGLEVTYDWGALKETSRWQGDKTSCWRRLGIAELFRKTETYIKGAEHALHYKQ